MMNGLTLLIVDDETATREGLRAAIDFGALGIDRVLEAADGAEGLRVSSSCRPDIILSDVRMPRMTGVEMLDRVRAFLPGCVFIFMSGFSDKEYLMAAIRLKAVSYVEKPLHFPEVEQALRDAVKQKEEQEEHLDAASVRESVAASRAALLLASPVEMENDPPEFTYLRRIYGDASRYQGAASILFRIRPAGADGAASGLLAENAEEILSDRTARDPLLCIGAEKYPDLVVLHIFRKMPLGENTAFHAAERLAAGLPAGTEWYAAAGPAVVSVRKLSESYSAAAVLLEQGYFLPPCRILRPAPGGRADLPLTEMTDRVLEAVAGSDEKACENALADLSGALTGNTVLPRRTVQAAYYRIAAALDGERKAKHLPPGGSFTGVEPFLSALEDCFCFSEMHELLRKEAGSFFRDLSSHSPDSAPVYLIREYIRAHYGDPMLSTKEISEHVSLSASYACTVFKNETGKTLNQYLTEYRMEKAKKYLADPRGTVSDVAEKCGYNDSNYFGKAFKKYTGLSPSEYRESLS